MLNNQLLLPTHRLWIFFKYIFLQRQIHRVITGTYFSEQRMLRMNCMGKTFCYYDTETLKSIRGCKLYGSLWSMNCWMVNHTGRLIYHTETLNIRDRFGVCYKINTGKQCQWEINTEVMSMRNKYGSDKMTDRYGGVESILYLHNIQKHIRIRLCGSVCFMKSARPYRIIRVRMF